MTNDLVGNKIVSLSINGDGKVGSLKAISTGGVGQHGVNTPFGPDPLFSSGSIQVNRERNFLVNVNPGSNTLSMFSINNENPTKLQLIGSPVSSRGQFPISVAINKEGNLVCALNGGAVNGINCYKPDPKLGLIEKPNTLRSLGIKQSTPPTGPPGTASQILLSPDGKKVIASVKGVPPAPGKVASGIHISLTALFTVHQFIFTRVPRSLGYQCRWFSFRGAYHLYPNCWRPFAIFYDSHSWQERFSDNGPRYWFLYLRLWSQWSERECHIN